MGQIPLSETEPTPEEGKNSQSTLHDKRNSLTILQETSATSQEAQSSHTRTIKTLKKESRPASLSNERVVTSSLHAISAQRARDKDLPELKFKPVILRTGFMCAIIAFDLIVLGLLFLLWFYESFTFSHEWGYFAIQILPPIIGTITSSLMRAVAITFCRITPFMLAAAGSTFQKTILASYFPGLSLCSAIQAGNGLLVLVWIIEFLVGFVLSFKSALLNTTRYVDYVETVVTSWAVKALTGIYILTIILMIILTYEMYDRVTGLRWDPVSIADHLVLFRHSNFLDEFEGTDIATRASIADHFQDCQIKLGYWMRGDEVWHGFGAKAVRVEERLAPIDHIEQANQEQTELQAMRNAPKLPKTKSFLMSEVSRTRYRSVALNMEHWMAYVWVGATLLLLATFVSGLAFDLVNGKSFSISYNWATVIFQFLPAFLVSFYSWFWQDVDLFARSTQPFRGMSSPRAASETLLLDYNNLPPLVVTYAALAKGHHRVAWTSLMAVVQRLLPIITAGSTTVVPEYQGATIYASKPLFICITVWLGLYCFLIPLEIFGWNSFRQFGKRHLPRSYSSISDLISWSYASKILRSDNGDPFDIDLLDKKRTESWYITARLMIKQDDDAEDFAKYSFGLYESTRHKGVKCMGFDVASNVQRVNLRRKNGGDGEAAKEVVTMHAPKNLRHLLKDMRERATNPKTLNEQSIPPQEE